MRRRVTVVTSVLIAASVATVAASAAWIITGTGSSSATASSLAAPTGVSGALVGAGAIDISYTAPSNPAGTTTTVTRDKTAAGAAGATVVCSGNNTTPCHDTGLASGITYTYTVASVLNGWTRASATTPTVTVTSLAAPTSVTLAGAGQGNVYVNSDGKASVSVSVVLPASSVVGNSVHLTVADVGAAHTVTPTVKPGTAGAGTVTFTGLDLTTLNDGLLTLTAWVTNGANSSANTNAATTYTKDVVGPTTVLSLTAPTTAGRSFSAALVDTVVHFDPCQNKLFGFRMVSTASDATSGPFSTTFPALTAGGWTSHNSETPTTPPFTSTDYLWSANNCGPSIASTPFGTFNVVVTDNAGNTATTGLTFLADSTPPTGSPKLNNRATGGTVGKIEAADFVEVTYSEDMAPASFCNTWTSSGTQALANTTVTVTKNDGLTVANAAAGGCTLRFGTVSLIKNYNSSNSAMTFTGSSFAYDPTTKKVTITLGTLSDGTQGTGLTAAVPTYAAGSLAETDLVGIPVADTDGTSSQF